MCTDSRRTRGVVIGFALSVGRGHGLRIFHSCVGGWVPWRLCADYFRRMGAAIRFATDRFFARHDTTHFWRLVRGTRALWAGPSASACERHPVRAPIRNCSVTLSARRTVGGSWPYLGRHPVLRRAVDIRTNIPARRGIQPQARSVGLGNRLDRPCIIRRRGRLVVADPLGWRSDSPPTKRAARVSQTGPPFSFAS